MRTQPITVLRERGTFSAALQSEGHGRFLQQDQCLPPRRNAAPVSQLLHHYETFTDIFPFSEATDVKMNRS